MADTARIRQGRAISPAHPSSSTTAAQPKVASFSKRSPLHPEDVHVSRLWLALGGLGGLIYMVAMWRYGWRAALAGGFLGTLAGIYATLIEPRNPKIERHTLRFKRLPAALDGLRIGHISDSHLGVPFAARNLDWAVAQMQREQPDLIVFTGDFVHHAHGLDKLSTTLAGLRAPLGVYAVTGNHDHWEARDTLMQVLEAHAIMLLDNQHQHLQWQGGECWLLGTDDVWDGNPNLEAALRGVPADGFVILLAHTPHGAPVAAQQGIDLQLSGHTHGGHMMLPLIGPIARPRFTDGFFRGLFRVGTMTLYVSRGIGGMPVRFNSRPEVAIHTLRVDQT